MRLVFRMGDFYEMFYDDAVLANKVLGVTLTQRTTGIPMAGVPYHSVDGYLRRMIQAGHRVAVCDQMEAPSQAKGIVRRQVTRVITPGTLTDELLLDEGRENTLAAITLYKDDQAVVAWTELSTGSFAIALFDQHALQDELARIAPSELIYPEPANGDTPPRIAQLIDALDCAKATRPTWQFRQTEAVETLRRQFQVATLQGFGIDESDPALGPASAIVHYLLDTQQPISDDTKPSNQEQTDRNKRLAHLQPPRLFLRTNHLMIDQASLRSLEVEQTIRSNTTQGTLLGTLQACVTAMGKRRLRQWLCYPLCSRPSIEKRQRIVGALIDDQQWLSQLRTTLDQIQDIQRITSRIAVGRATPRDMVALGISSAQTDLITQLLADRPAVFEYYKRLSVVAKSIAQLANDIASACVDAPPPHLREGGLIKDGYDSQLDEYRRLRTDSHTWLANYQKQLIEQSGIQNLKVGFNKVFGYYIEVTAANKHRAPDTWTRKQTLKNAERYMTPQLKTFEGKVLSAQQRAVTREIDIFAQLCAQAHSHLDSLRVFADMAAQLDVLACFAKQAISAHYVKPTIVDQPVLDISAGRHPVLDQLLADRFVPNDTQLGSTKAITNGDIPPTLALITGPNMAGKSTFIRQTALITLMAHTGSFVPADAATIGLCDRIFTRIGASDELHTGQSTFMVEMTEAANICHHATPASLVILDEIGRGTSTLDGLSLAWAIAEFLANRRSRTLFATHYHELTSLSENFDNVTNLNVTVRDWDDQIVFLHRMVTGATDRSYGIHVAKIAGMPQPIIQRANELLGQLTVNHSSHSSHQTQNTSQLPLFTEHRDHPVLQQLQKLDLQNITPITAFDLLRQLQEQVSH